jgi:phosphoglycolate phosphatase
MLRAVLFDFDLTLADSAVGATDCCNFALQSVGLGAVDQATVRSTIGLPLPEVFRALSGSVDASLAGRFARAFVQRADLVMTDLTQVYPTVPVLLRTLRGRGIQTAIVSTKFRYRILEIMKRAEIANLIDAIIGGEDVARAKPHPEGVLAGLAALNVEPHGALYVGDHFIDALAARAADVDFVGVLTGTTDRTTFAAHDVAVEHVIDSVDELAGHLLLRYPELA